MKTCNRCLVEKDPGEFHARQARCKVCSSEIEKERWRKSREGIYERRDTHWHKLLEVDDEKLTAYCTECKKYVGISRRARNGYECNVRRAERSRAGHLRRHYGITTETFTAMLDAQGGGCKLCKRKADNYAVDHDHSCCPAAKTCGKCIRGIVCHPCNVMIGHIENYEIGLSAIRDYLRLK